MKPKITPAFKATRTLAFASLAVAIFTLQPHAMAAECCGNAELQQNESCCDDKPYEPAADKVCCNDKGVYNPQEREGVKLSITATDHIKAKIGNVLSKIPNVGEVEIQEAEAGFVNKKSDCCPAEGAPKIEGIKTSEGSVEFSAELKNIKIYGPPTQEFNQSFGSAQFQLMVNVGATLTLNLGVSGTFGAKEDLCEPENTCSYGGISLDLKLVPEVKFEMIGCVKIWGYENCQEIDIVPIKCEFAISGGVTYNDGGDCEKGLEGDFTLGSITISCEFRLAGVQVSKSWEVYEGA